jgi:hypothetical protein
MTALGVPFYPVSAVTGDGIGALTEAMWRTIMAAKNDASGA